jgi:hypothetical protein
MLVDLGAGRWVSKKNRGKKPDESLEYSRNILRGLPKHNKMPSQMN